jgi:hypothetical protein
MRLRKGERGGEEANGRGRGHCGSWHLPGIRVSDWADFDFRGLYLHAGEALSMPTMREVVLILISETFCNRVWAVHHRAIAKKGNR